MDSRPNVVVVVLDALRADRIGSYGCDKELTPNIDSFASESAVFENAFACTNTTDPSITSIHTGRFPLSTVYHHGPYVTKKEKKRIESVETVPEVLSSAGWKTISTGRFMGRWHKNGFDIYPTPDIEQRLVKYRNKVNLYHPLIQKPLSLGFRVINYIGPSTAYQSGDTGSAVNQFLGDIEEEPFYGLVHLMDTHTPYDADTSEVESLLDTYDYPEGGLYRPGEGNGTGYEVTRPWITDRDYEYGIGRLIARYDALVKQSDEKVGDLIDGLKEKGVWENTVLFVLSDHGESLVEHSIYHDHHGLYDPTVHVPLIGRFPGEAACRVKEFVQLHDIAPTVLELCELEFSEEIDGFSLRPLVEGDSPDWPREEAFFCEAHTQRRDGVRTDRWKYIEHRRDERLEQVGTDSLRCRYCDVVHGGKWELYDIISDPKETNNLCDDNPNVSQRLSNRISRHNENLESIQETSGIKEYEHEKELMERLEELGYR